MTPRKTTVTTTQTTHTRTLLVNSVEGVFKVTIPSASKVTFGPFNPGGNGMRASGGGTLRIYEAENRQLACFVGVISFRDLALPVEYQVIEEEGETKWSKDAEGEAFSRQSKQAKKWVEAPF